MSTEDALTTTQPAAADTAAATSDDLSAIHTRVDHLAGTIDAIQSAFQQKNAQLADVLRLSDELQMQLDALQSTNLDLQNLFEEKARALTDSEMSLVALQDAFGVRNQEFDALHARIQALTAEIDVILAPYAEAEPADVVSPEMTAAGEKPAEDRSPFETIEGAPAMAGVEPVPAAETTPYDPMDVLGSRVAALVALLSRKVDAVAIANVDVNGVRAQLAAVQAECNRLADGVAEIDSQLANHIGEYEEVQIPAETLGAAPVTAAVDTFSEESAASPPSIASVADRVAALAAVLQRKRQEIDDAQNQIALLEEHLGAVTTKKTNLEITLNEKEQSLSSVAAQATSWQSELQAKNVELELLIQQATDTQVQLAAAQEANRALESQIATLNATVAANGQQLNEVDGRMNELAAALEATDDDAEDQAATRLATVSVAAGGATALAAAVRKQKDARRAAQAEMDTLRQQLAEVTVAKDTLEVSMQHVVANADPLNAQIESLTANKAALEQALADSQAQLEQVRSEYAEAIAAREATAANLAGASADDLNAQIASLTADKVALAQQLADSEVQLQQERSEFLRATAWQQRAPAIANLGQRLSLISDTKLAAANSSAAAGSMPHMVSASQNLADVKGIGRVYEQRLYSAGVGSFWEMAVCGDDALKRILDLNELQMLHTDLDAIRADARRLAEETGTTGMLWDGEVPDDFEPIDGIGKTFEQRLYNAGIRTYKALAATTPEQLAHIVKARKPLQPDYQSWIDQARALMQSAHAE